MGSIPWFGRNVAVALRLGFVAPGIFLWVAVACAPRTQASTPAPPQGTPMATPLAVADGGPAEETVPTPDDPPDEAVPPVEAKTSEASPSPEVATATKAKKKRRPRGKRYPGPPLTHEEILTRQVEARIDLRMDKDSQVRLPLPDARHWKRVRFFGVDHLTGFTYGEDNDVVTSAFVVETDGPPTAAACLAKFESEGKRRLDHYKGTLSKIVEVRGTFKKEPLLIRRANGRVRVFFTTYEFAAAWAAYPVYDRGCLVYSVGIRRDDDDEAVERAMARWIKDAFSRPEFRDRALPFRHE